MADATTLGTWLRRERERRGVTLSQISEQTKLSVAILEGLELDDLSRWPGGIFRRAYSRSYATAVGLDPDLLVRRVEEAHPVADGVPVPTATSGAQSMPRGQAVTQAARPSERRTRVLAVSLDLLVAGALGFGFAAAGSRLLWPVLAIAAYHALGLLLAGRSPMLALLTDAESAPVLVPAPVPAHEPSAPAPRIDRAQTSAGRSSGRGHRQVSRRAARSARRA
jgi:transcriptional regulator with XRE-family HTH domain